MSMMDTSQIQNGWDVYGSDGDKVGDVSDVGPNYVLVTKGFLFTKDIYIPTSAITGIENDRVYLNVSKDQVDSMGWDQAPVSDTGYGTAAFGTGTATTTGYTDTTTMSDNDTTVTTQTSVEDTTGYTEVQAAPTQQYTTTTSQPVTASTSTDDNIRVQRYEEELSAQKVAREAGEVRITKDVVQEEQTLEVPVTREEVHIESHIVDRAATDTSQAFQGGTISVPVREEDVTVSKQVRVAEELEIEKTAVQETERVSDTVRREVVNVEQVGDVEVEGGSTGTMGSGGTTRR